MSIKSIVFCACVAFATISLAQGIQQSSFGVHRLLQYSVDSTIYGSQKAAVSMPGTTLGSSSSYSGLMLVLKVDSIDLSKLKQV
jgi:hypothetical protein